MTRLVAEQYHSPSPVRTVACSAAGRGLRVEEQGKGGQVKQRTASQDRDEDQDEAANVAMLTASASVRLRTALSGSTLREEGLEEEPLMRGSEGASQVGTQAGTGESPQRRMYSEMEGGRGTQGMGPSAVLAPGGSRQKSPLAWLGEVKGGEANGKDKGKGCWASLQGDMGSICLLLLLYTLQGVPMGLSGSIPFLLTDRYDTKGTQFVFLHPPHTTCIRHDANLPRGL